MNRNHPGPAIGMYPCGCGKGFFGPRGGRCDDCRAAGAAAPSDPTMLRAHCPYCGTPVTCKLRHFAPEMKWLPEGHLVVTAVLKGPHDCAAHPARNRI